LLASCVPRRRRLARPIREGKMAKEWKLGESAVEDVFEMAALVEQGGYDFYERLHAHATDRRVKKKLEFLRDDEAAHKVFFLEQLRNQGRTPRGAVGPELQIILEREFIEPLQKMFSFSDINNNFKTLGFGLMLEQKSVDLYAEMKTVVNEEQKADFDRIIAEEEGHRRKLQLIRAYY
jgi:rubrerythrin